MKMLIPGKRYEWNINNVDSKKKSGIYTGQFDPHNGNATLVTKTGEFWSVPAYMLTLKKGKKR